MLTKFLTALGAAILFVIVAAYTLIPVDAQNVPCYRQQGGAVWVAGSGCTYVFQSGSTLDIQTGATANISGTLQIGDAGLFALGYPTANQEVVCGTVTVTDTADITTTGLTAITYATAVMATDPASTASIVTIDPPSGITLTLNIWESDFTVGTTGAEVYYCAIGDE